MRKIIPLICFLQWGLIAFSQDAKPIPYGKNKDAGKFYSIRGIQMYCEVYGEGQPILFIHGNSQDITAFVNNIPYFSAKYKVIVADSRNHGKSVDKGDSLTYEMMADDYSALLEQLHVDSAYVVGWSDGGIEGLLLAIRHPEKVMKLAITGANLQPDTLAVYKEVWDIVRPDYETVKKMTPKTGDTLRAWKQVRLLFEQPHISLAALHTIRCPTLVIGGDHDVIKPEHTMLISQNIARSYLWILPNSGHSTPMTYKDIFNKTVDDFLSKPYRRIHDSGRFN
jgi:pimeloyl-ACP methyl ester carboxylesterase